MKWLGVFLVFGATLGFFIYVVAVFDPFKWGVEQSGKFSWSSFGEVKEGDRIDEVIERLGEPIRPAEEIAVLTEDPHDPCIKGAAKSTSLPVQSGGRLLRRQ